MESNIGELKLFLTREIEKTLLKSSKCLEGSKEFCILKSREESYYNVLNYIKNLDSNRKKEEIWILL